MTPEALKEIIALHSKWRRGEPGGARADLTDANLTDANLADANLADANLTGADLTDAIGLPSATTNSDPATPEPKPWRRLTPEERKAAPAERALRSRPGLRSTCRHGTRARPRTAGPDSLCTSPARLGMSSRSNLARSVPGPPSIAPRLGACPTSSRTTRRPSSTSASAPLSRRSSAQDRETPPGAVPVGGGTGADG